MTRFRVLYEGGAKISGDLVVSRQQSQKVSRYRNFNNKGMEMHMKSAMLLKILTRKKKDKPFVVIFDTNRRFICKSESGSGRSPLS